MNVRIQGFSLDHYSFNVTQPYHQLYVFTWSLLSHQKPWIYFKFICIEGQSICCFSVVSRQLNAILLLNVGVVHEMILWYFVRCYWLLAGSCPLDFCQVCHLWWKPPANAPSLVRIRDFIISIYSRYSKRVTVIGMITVWRINSVCLFIISYHLLHYYTIFSFDLIWFYFTTYSLRYRRLYEKTQIKCAGILE